MASMVSIRADDPRAVAAFEAIHGGDVRALERLLVDDPETSTRPWADRRGGETTRPYVR